MSLRDKIEDVLLETTGYAHKHIASAILETLASEPVAVPVAVPVVVPVAVPVVAWITDCGRVTSDRILNTSMPKSGRAAFKNALCKVDDVQATVADLQVRLEAAEKDAARLDFVLKNKAWTQAQRTDAGGLCYCLMIQTEDEDYVRLSGDDTFFKTEREAIDAALSKKAGE